MDVAQGLSARSGNLTRTVMLAEMGPRVETAELSPIAPSGHNNHPTPTLLSAIRVNTTNLLLCIFIHA